MSGRLLRFSVVVLVSINCLAFAAGSASATGTGAQLTAIVSPSHRAARRLVVFGGRGQRLVAPTLGPGVAATDVVSWGPGGRQLAYINPGIDFPTALVAHADGSDLRSLSAGYAEGNLAFDPAGDVVVSTLETFPTQPGPDYGSGYAYRSVLTAAPTDGSESRVLASFGPGVIVRQYSFAPDGVLVAAAVTPQGAGIAAVSHGGASLRWIVGPSGGVDLSPVVSPDGSSIVYLRDQSVGNSSVSPRLVSTKLMSVPLRGGKPKVLATVAGGARWPSWDPSGSRLAFTALALKERDGSFYPGSHSALMEVNADGTCLVDVYSASHGGAVWGASWRPGPGRGAGPISC